MSDRERASAEPDSQIPSVVTDERGPMKLMAVANGYVMARRPGAIPFVRTVKEWLALKGEERS